MRASGCEVRGDFGAEQGDQFRIVAFVVVRNAQRDEALAGEFVGEALAQAVGGLALHAEDDVGPADVAGGDFNACAVFRARRAGLRNAGDF